MAKGVRRPSKPENEYFVREDAESKRRLAFQVKKQLAAEELRRLKQTHWNRCPKCGLEMHQVKFRGVDVDVCFPCGGIYLERHDIENLEREKPPGVMSSILNWFKAETEHPIQEEDEDPAGKESGKSKKE